MGDYIAIAIALVLCVVIGVVCFIDDDSGFKGSMGNVMSGSVNSIKSPNH